MFLTAVSPLLKCFKSDKTKLFYSENCFLKQFSLFAEYNFLILFFIQNLMQSRYLFYFIDVGEV